jgi:hypothetical protein
MANDSADDGGGDGAVGVIVGVVVAIAAVAGFAIFGFVLWRRRGQNTFPDSASEQSPLELVEWKGNGELTELEELAPPLIAQTDIATFSEVLTYADDNQLGFHMDEPEGAFSLL